MNRFFTEIALKLRITYKLLSLFLFHDNLINNYVSNFILIKEINKRLYAEKNKKKMPNLIIAFEKLVGYQFDNLSGAFCSPTVAKKNS